MIITLINFISEKINEFRRRNRNKPTYYRLFLFWLTMIILVTIVFYILNNLDLENNLNNEELSYNPTNISDNIINSTNISPPNPTGPIFNSNNINHISAAKGVSTISQASIYEVPKSQLYHEVLNKVAQIPKPLSFVDDFNYKL
jgi:hypothetical protein